MQVSSPIARRTQTTLLTPRVSTNSSTFSITVAAMESSCIGVNLLRCEKACDFVKTGAGFTTGGHHVDRRLEGVDIADELLHVHTHYFGEVGFVNHYHIGA